MSTARSVKHLSLHRIAGTELRVVADVEAGVLPLVDLEEKVIRRYIGLGNWPHRWVTLFVLQDLAPLARQLGAILPRELGDSGRTVTGPELATTNRFLGRAEDVSLRPVVSVYDLADLGNCHVFVSQTALSQAGLWGDRLALEALLAHEHAHPLTESALTQLSRRSRVELAVSYRNLGAPGFHPASSNSVAASAIATTALVQWLQGLADELVRYAPRELLANELVLRAGLAEALEHLDRRTLAQAVQDLKGRKQLAEWLRREVAQGSITPALAELHLMSADLRHANLALEVASFLRAGRESAARQLESELQASLLAQLDPFVAPFYAILREQYVALRPEAGPAELLAWGQTILDALAKAAAAKGLELVSRLYLADDNPATSGNPATSA